MSGVAESMIENIDWAVFCASIPQAEAFAGALGALLGAEDSEAAEAAWWGIENFAFAQETVYELAVPTTDVLFAALIDRRSELVREWIVEVLYFITTGGSADDPTIPERCRDRARLGLWLLAREATVRCGPGRDRILDVIDSVDKPFCAVLRHAIESEA